MEIIVLIITIIGLLPIYFLIKTKLKKRYKFDLDYKNITFATFWNPTNPKLDGRLCIMVYILSIVNGSDEPNTLNKIYLSYRYKRKKYQAESYVVPTGKLPKSGEPGIVLSHKKANIVFVGWYNIRTKLLERELLQSGGVFSGSAIYLFESHVTNLRYVQNLALIVYDYYGNKSTYPITIQEDWFKSLDNGFIIINEQFTFNDDGSIKLISTST